MKLPVAGALAPWWGKFGGLVLGVLLLGWPGIILGLACGHVLDEWLRLAPFTGRVWEKGPWREPERTLMTATFAAMGHIAKADGRVSKQEVATAEAVMREFRLDGEWRRRAIDLFTRGKHERFPFAGVIRRLRAELEGQTALVERFLVYQMRVAHADGRPAPEQLQLLILAGRTLNVPKARFEKLMERFESRRDTHGRRQQVRPTLESAFALLGVDEHASEEEIKRAYRRAISRHHPDRLVAQGAPEHEVREAARRTREIRSAYEQVRKVRGFP